MIEARADVNVINPRGDSALSLASHNAVLLKLVLGADPDVAHLVRSSCALCARGCPRCMSSVVQRALKAAKAESKARGGKWS